jgi:hypothetical protein
LWNNSWIAIKRAEVEWGTRPAVAWLEDYGWCIDNLRLALDWAFRVGIDQLSVALENAQRFRALASTQHDRNDRLIGERITGAVQHLLDDQASAPTHRAHGFARAGHIADGLAATEEAMEHAVRTQARWQFSESLRIRGKLLLLQAAAGAAAAAEDHFGQALDWARPQGALSLELHAATSLARLWCDQGLSAEARALL